jgi:polyisoprenoid-binding protein YceI
MTSKLNVFRLLSGPAAVLAAAATAMAGPPGTTYTLIPAKSSLTYTFTQAGGANVGSFKAFSVNFDPTGGRLSVVIDMRSFDTGDQQRNSILRGKDLFDVAQYPQARFISMRIEKTPSGFTARGLLTIRGVTRPATVSFTWRTVPAQGDGATGYLNGQSTIPRLDFGIGQGQWKSTEWVGNDVTVHYSLQLQTSERARRGHMAQNSAQFKSWSTVPMPR